ncbi:MAG: arabinose efflux permease family protein [Clostridia bacterium]|nr:arabinose efflux permease family protein [Clostridia bacterium]
MYFECGGKKLKKRDLVLFLIASAFLGVSQSIDSSVFNNFLHDTFNITVTQRTILEFPREFPGFLVVFVSGALLALGDVRIAAIANILAAAGMMGLGYLSKDFGTMMIWMTVYSMGQHLFLPVSSSIGMNLADKNNMGKILGRINGVNTAAFLLTSLGTALIFRFVKVSYPVAYTVGAISFLCSAILIFKMTPHKAKSSGKRLFVKKEYTLFYFLSILYGARKQIFITFGPWVLIKVFNQGVTTFAMLGFIIAAIGIFFKPFVGDLIDKKGERFILAAEAILLIAVCMGYAIAGNLGLSLKTALLITAACYILDQLLQAAGMARSTYLKKIAVCPEDVSPTLSMGISMDHVVSMVVPWLGGLVWNVFGYEMVFVLGALIAAGNLFITRYIKIAEQPE